VCSSDLSRIDGPSLWMAKEKSEWGSVVQGDDFKTRLRPLETVPIQMFIRSGQDVDSRAVEAQVTLERLPGRAAGKAPRFGFGTNWLEGLTQTSGSVAEDPETHREQR
jgi:hypothetical protein